MKAFEINPNTNTISVHQDNMNPTEVKELIRRLNGNLSILLQIEADPISVMTQSVRMIPSDKEIVFRLSWSAEPITVSLDTDQLPDPNIDLTDKQRCSYVDLLWTMIEGANNG